MSVICDHCEREIPDEEAIPCYWEEYQLVWYYCKECHESLYPRESDNN